MPTVLCIAIDQNRKTHTDPFKVTYDASMDIDGLKPMVVKNEPLLQGVPYQYVLVYHQPDVKAILPRSQLQTAISALDLSRAEVSVAQLVQDVAAENGLLIFQRLPVAFGPPSNSQSTSFKRPRSPSNDTSQYTRLNKAKFLRVSPSDIGQLSFYWSLQSNDNEKLLDDRPNPDFHVPPIPLLYEPFGEFHDIFAGRVPVPADIDIDWASLQLNVDDLAAGMSLRFKDEHERRDTALRHLQRIFVCKFPPSAIVAYQTDGHSEIHQMVDTIIKIRNELPGINAFPYAQSTAYVGQSHKRSDAIQELCNRCRLPALCITIVGPQIQFFAVLLLGHQYRVVSLTPGLSCCPSATNGQDRKHLYSAFSAAIVLRQRIRHDLDSYHQAPPPTLTGKEFYFPAISAVLKHNSPAENQSFLRFKILDHYGDRVPFRHLYKARVTNSLPKRDILLKFTRQYCMELHDHCSALGHAPNVLGFQQLSGGWFAVAMEILPDAKSIKSVLRRGEKDELLLNLVDSFHAKGLVHGDLRYTNIICDDSGETIWIVDFDWGGKAGEAQCPTWLLNKALWDDRQSKDLTIRQEDDLRILKATLAALDS